MKNAFASGSEASRSLLKYGVIFAYLVYLLYGFVTEYFSGTTEGFTLPYFIIGALILGGGCIFLGKLTLQAWKKSQEEAAAAIDAAEKPAEE